MKELKGIYGGRAGLAAAFAAVIGKNFFAAAFALAEAEFIDVIAQGRAEEADFIGIGVLFLGMIGCAVWNTRMLSALYRRITGNLKERVLGAYFLKAGRQPVKEKESLAFLTNDLEVVIDCHYTMRLNLAFDLIELAFSCAALLFVDWRLGLVMCGLTLLSSRGIDRLSERLAGYQNACQEAAGNFTAGVMGILQGFLPVHNYRMEAAAEAEYDRKSAAYEERKYLLEKKRLQTELFGVLSNLAIYSLVMILGGWFALRGMGGLGELIAAVSLSGTAVTSLNLFNQHLALKKGAKDVTEKVADYVLSETEEPMQAISPQENAARKEDLPLREVFLQKMSEYQKLSLCTGEERLEPEEVLRAEHLTFAYDSGRVLLDDVSLTLRRGRRYALAGPSGEGKTTLLELLAGRVLPDAGRIVLGVNDGTDSAEAKKGSEIAYLAQNPTVFEGSVRENICMFEPNPDPERLRLAAERAGLTRDGEGFLDTAVKAFGANLSGGQRQRIAIARVLYSGRPILLFDEMLSALDDDTADYVEEQVLTRSQDAVIVHVTHKIFQRERYDEILTLKNGRLIHENNH